MLLLIKLITVLFLSNTLQIKAQDIAHYDFELLGDHVFYAVNETNSVGVFSNSIDGSMNPIQRGKGPFEIENLGAFCKNLTQDKFYAIDISSGRLIVFSADGKALREKTIPTTYNLNLTALDNDLLLAPGQLLNKSARTDSNYPIAFFIDDINLQITDTLFFNLLELNIQDIRDVNKLNVFELRPYPVLLDSNTIFLTFEGFEGAFLVDRKSNILSEVKFDIPNYEGMFVQNHPMYGFGQAIFSVSNDHVLIDDTIHLAFGHKSRNIPHGLAQIRISGRKMSEVQMYTVPDSNSLMNEFRISVFNNNIYTSEGTALVILNQ
jgi:hypothetical protein